LEEKKRWSVSSCFFFQHVTALFVFSRDGRRSDFAVWVGAGKVCFMQRYITDTISFWTFIIDSGITNETKLTGLEMIVSAGLLEKDDKIP
jgi:hypothetical protein